MDKIRALRYFKRVAELHSFTQAAEEFGIPASSISRRIKDLEKMLGIELLQRSGADDHADAIRVPCRAVTPHTISILVTHCVLSVGMIIGKTGSETDTVLAISIVFKATML